jgi:hypothetical protein
MKTYHKPLLAAVLVVPLLAASTGVFGQQAAPKPETLIKWRQSAYQVLGWSSSRIKASVEGQYNKEEVIKAANTIAVLANSGLGSLFAPGTEQGSRLARYACQARAVYRNQTGWRTGHRFHPRGQ